MARQEGLVCIFAKGKNEGFAPSSRRRQRSSALHLILRVLATAMHKSVQTTVCAWLLKCGTPGGTRTPDLLLRRQLLYPAELLAHLWSG